MREIDVAAALEHPNIVRFVASGTNNGAVYLVSEFVDGSDAARLADAQGGRLPYAQAIDIVAQALDALSYAHTKGYIHRDIKESNILISGEAPNLIAKLTDFGLAKSFTQSGMSGITMAGDMAGTFAYMPPEQIKDFRNVRPTSDIYAIGMTAYSLLAGGKRIRPILTRMGTPTSRIMKWRMVRRSLMTILRAMGTVHGTGRTNRRRR